MDAPLDRIDSLRTRIVLAAVLATNCLACVGEIIGPPPVAGPSSPPVVRKREKPTPFDPGANPTSVIYFNYPWQVRCLTKSQEDREFGSKTTQEMSAKADITKGTAAVSASGKTTREINRGAKNSSSVECKPDEVGVTDWVFDARRGFALCVDPEAYPQAPTQFIDIVRDFCDRNLGWQHDVDCGRPAIYTFDNGNVVAHNACSAGLVRDDFVDKRASMNVTMAYEADPKAAEWVSHAASGRLRVHANVPFGSDADADVAIVRAQVALHRADDLVTTLGTFALLDIQDITFAAEDFTISGERAEKLSARLASRPRVPGIIEGSAIRFTIDRGDAPFIVAGRRGGGMKYEMRWPSEHIQGVYDVVSGALRVTIHFEQKFEVGKGPLTATGTATQEITLQASLAQDADGDAVSDANDVCPLVRNAGQNPNACMPHVVTVTVLDASGQPKPHAWVYAYQGGQLVPGPVGQTDAAGQAVLTVGAEGSYRFGSSDGSLSQFSGDLDHCDNSCTTATIQFRYVNVRVIKADGTPAVGAWVYPYAGNEALPWPAQTGADGVARAPVVSAGAYRFGASNGSQVFFHSPIDDCAVRIPGAPECNEVTINFP